MRGSLRAATLHVKQGAAKLKTEILTGLKKWPESELAGQRKGAAIPHPQRLPLGSVMENLGVVAGGGGGAVGSFTGMTGGG